MSVFNCKLYQETSFLDQKRTNNASFKEIHTYEPAKTQYATAYVRGDWVRQRCRDLKSPGRPTDIGLQLGKACYACSR